MFEKVFIWALILECIIISYISYGLPEATYDFLRAALYVLLHYVNIGSGSELLPKKIQISDEWMSVCVWCGVMWYGGGGCGGGGVGWVGCGVINRK